ncbi:hypothetical protein D3C87_1727120 [compost metagenome]
MCLDEIVGERADAFGVGRVHDHRGHAGIGGRYLIQHILTAAGNDDLVAQPVKRFRQRPADAGAATGDENGVACRFHRKILCLLDDGKLAAILSIRK